MPKLDLDIKLHKDTRVQVTKKDFDRIKSAIANEVEELRKSRLARAFADALSPKPRLTINEWADQYRELPQISSHETGLWRTSRFPFLKRIMELLSPDDPTQQVVVMKGAQLGFTEIALNFMYYNIDYHPAPMMYVQKTLDNISIFMDQRFEPSIEAMPTVKDKIGFVKSGKLRGDTKRTKIFPGGMIRFAGANSASSLRSMPIRFLILDEEDSYDCDVMDEGSPSELAIARTRNFPNRKIFRLSTPTLKETSMVEPLFEEGTGERFHVSCPYCNHKDWMKWENIKWQLDDNGNIIPDTVGLLCTSCGTLIPETKKTEMLDKGEWVAERPNAPFPSFHISSLYAPFGFFSWTQAITMFVTATKTNNENLLKGFVNTVLGETWSTTGKIFKTSLLMKRKENYAAPVPKEVVLLTSGSDVQENRIETEVVGWTRDMQSYSIDYRVFMGDTAKNAVWEQYHDYLVKRWTHESGEMIPIAISVVDSGFLTETVHKFCRYREHLNIFPIRGASGWGKGYIERPKKRNKHGTMGFAAFVDEIKSKFYSQLTIDEVGPNYCHFPEKDVYDSHFFKMLTAENLMKKWSQGRYRIAWHCPQGRRNEALDCRVYNIAALNILNPDFDSLPINKLFKVAYAPRQKQKKKRRVLNKGMV